MPDNVGESRHAPSYDTARINDAVERASADDSFIVSAVDTLRGLEFPAFKQAIVEHARQAGAHPQAIALFESLNGYIEFRDAYHVRKALEENNAGKKQEHQISEETRTRPDVRTRPSDAQDSIKDREAKTVQEERQDYPEVPPSAMSNYICDRCGKPFQNQQDFLKHREFESGGAVT